MFVILPLYVKRIPNPCLTLLFHLALLFHLVAGGGAAAASMRVGTSEQNILRQRDFYIDPGQPAQHLEWGH